MKPLALLFLLAAARDAGVAGDPFGARKGGAPQKLERASLNALVGERSADGGVGPELQDASAVSPPKLKEAPLPRIHLFASEELNPDLLRSLARPMTTLWLQTRSNMLADSTLEVLRRAGASFVQFHPPVQDTHARRFLSAPKAGVWLDSKDLGGNGVYRLGARLLAVELNGAPDSDGWRKLLAAKPAFTWWATPVCDASAYQAFAELPGRKVLVTPPRDCALPIGAHTDVAVRGADVKLPPGLDPARAIIWLPPSANAAFVRGVANDRPGVEFAITVGKDEGAALSARRLLDELERGPSP